MQDKPIYKPSIRFGDEMVIMPIEFFFSAQIKLQCLYFTPLDPAVALERKLLAITTRYFIDEFQSGNRIDIVNITPLFFLLLFCLLICSFVWLNQQLLSNTLNSGNEIKPNGFVNMFDIFICEMSFCRKIVPNRFFGLRFGLFIISGAREDVVLSQDEPI